MDCETVKLLILEKIFSVFAPKIIGYYKVLNNSEEYTWTPSLYYIPEHFRDLYSDTSINIHVSIDSVGNFVRIGFRKVKQREDGRTRRLRGMAGLALEPIEPPEIVELEFTNKQTAIREICKHIDVVYLTKIGMSAIKEIESHENPDNMSIGSIKHILGIKPGMDLNNLETRKVLIEKIK